MSNSCTRLVVQVVSAIAEMSKTPLIPWVKPPPVGHLGPICGSQHYGRPIILQSHTDTAGLHNARSPQLNLESLYGDGPTGNPFLYQRDDPAKFLLGPDGADLQRNTEGIAISATRATIRTC